MPRPAYKLFDLVVEGTFRANRHAHLLETDDYFVTKWTCPTEWVVKSQVELMANAKRSEWPAIRQAKLYLLLYDLIMWYRHGATNDAERRQAALAFAELANRSAKEPPLAELDFAEFANTTSKRYEAIFVREGGPEGKYILRGGPDGFVPCSLNGGRLELEAAR